MQTSDGGGCSTASSTQTSTPTSSHPTTTTTTTSTPPVRPAKTSSSIVLQVFDLPPPSFNSLKAWEAFFGKHSHRDKLGKIVHYGSRGMASLLGRLLSLFSQHSVIATILLATQTRFKALYLNVMAARRCVRWFSGLTILRQLIENSSKIPMRLKASKAFMLTWMASDHFRHLQKIKILGGDQAFTRNWGFACAAFSWGLAAYHHTMILLASKALPSETAAECDMRTAHENKTKRQIFRNIIASMSAMHISQLWITCEEVAGFFGAGAAAIDMYELFPRV